MAEPPIIVGCEECNEEVSVPDHETPCPLCGAWLWEEDDELPTDIPPKVERFVRRLGP